MAHNNKLIKINPDDSTFCWKDGGLGKSLADRVIGQCFCQSWLQDQINADDSDDDEYEGDDDDSEDDEGEDDADDSDDDDGEGDNV